MCAAFSSQTREKKKLKEKRRKNTIILVTKNKYKLLVLIRLSSIMDRSFRVFVLASARGSVRVRNAVLITRRQDNIVEY